MTLTYGVILSFASILISIGVAFGTVKQSLKTYKEKMDRLEKQMENLKNFDDSIRKYLFTDDGMTTYMPSVACIRQHEKLDKTLDELNKKMDKILTEILNKRNKQ